MKHRRFIGLCLILLVCACVYGCGNDDKKETTVSTKDAISFDDVIIVNAHKKCMALLSEEEFFADVPGNTVKVCVAGNGEITVEGMGSKSSKFLQLLRTYVYGSDTPTYQFASEVYRKGEPTILEFTFNFMLYSWSSNIYNSNEGSRYYRAR